MKFKITIGFLLAAAIACAQPYTVTGLTCKDVSGAVDTHKIAPGEKQDCTASLAWIGNPPTKATMTIGTVTYDFQISGTTVNIQPYTVSAPLTLTPSVLAATPVTGTSTVTFTVTYPSGAS